MRLWKVGTHRMLGIFSGPDAEKHDELDNERPEFPSNVERAFKPLQNQIFADFEVCPRARKPRSNASGLHRISEEHRCREMTRIIAQPGRLFNSKGAIFGDG